MSKKNYSQIQNPPIWDFSDFSNSLMAYLGSSAQLWETWTICEWAPQQLGILNFYDQGFVNFNLLGNYQPEIEISWKSKGREKGGIFNYQQSPTEAILLIDQKTSRHHPRFFFDRDRELEMTISHQLGILEWVGQSLKEHLSSGKNISLSIVFDHWQKKSFLGPYERKFLMRDIQIIDG